MAVADVSEKEDIADVHAHWDIGTQGSAQHNPGALRRDIHQNAVKRSGIAGQRGDTDRKLTVKARFAPSIHDQLIGTRAADLRNSAENPRESLALNGGPTP
jgi:hypothetical protein